MFRFESKTLLLVALMLFGFSHFACAAPTPIKTTNGDLAKKAAEHDFGCSEKSPCETSSNFRSGIWFVVVSPASGKGEIARYSVTENGQITGKMVGH